MDEHTKGLKRKISDRELRTSEAQRLRELASECAVEPADPRICDACAAYLILSETTDLEDQFQTGFNEGRPQGSSEPVMTRHDDGTVTMEWRSAESTTLISREVLEAMLDEHNELIQLVQRFTLLENKLRAIPGALPDATGFEAEQWLREWEKGD